MSKQGLDEQFTLVICERSLSNDAFAGQKFVPFFFCTVFTMFCNKRIIFALLSVAMPLNWKIKEIHQMLTYYLRDL